MVYNQETIGDFISHSFSKERKVYVNSVLQFYRDNQWVIEVIGCIDAVPLRLDYKLSFPEKEIKEYYENNCNSRGN